MRLKTLPALLAICALAPVAGCGGDSSDDASSDSPASMDEITVESGSFETDEDFAAAADDVCTQANEVLALSPVLGQYFPGLEAEAKQDVEKIDGREAKLGELEAPDDQAADFKEYLAEGKTVSESYADVAAAAAKSDQAAIDEAFNSITQAQDKREKLGKAMGFEVCAQDVDPTAKETITGSAADAEFPAVDGTIDDTAQEFLDASAKGDCKAVNDLVNSQFGEVAEADCAANKSFFSKAEIVGTAQYGPAGLVVYDADALGTIDSTFIRDEDGRLKFTGNRFLDGGGLNTPADGYDAEEVAGKVVAAIRDDDPKAFNETISFDVPDPKGGFYVSDSSFDSFGSDEKYGPMIVKDIRADEDAEPELLGANTNSAYFLLEANGNFYELGIAHDPGTDTGYSFSQYYALPE